MLSRMVTKKIGKRTEHFTATGNNLFELTMELEKLAFPDVEKCGLCGDNDLYLTAYLAQGKYKYTKIVCAKCGGGITFGQRQDNPDIFYLRRGEDKKYLWEKKVEKTEKQEPKKSDKFEDDDPSIPF